MAAPESVTIRNLSGDFVMNKSLTDEHDSILSMQGVGWLMRKGIGMSTITLHINMYEKDGVPNVDIVQVGTAGVKGTTERRHLDGQPGSHKDHIFGFVEGTSKFTKLDEVSDDFLKSGWLPETKDGDVISTNVVNKEAGWEAKQIWGFEEVQGERRYCRHAVVTKGSERKTCRMVYDYIGPLSRKE